MSFGQIFRDRIVELDVLFLEGKLEDQEELVEQVAQLFSGLNWLEL